LLFPGRRNARHYFPVDRKKDRLKPEPKAYQNRWYLTGLVQVLVDIEIQGPSGLAKDFGLVPGESIQLSATDHRRLLERIESEGICCSYAAGGTVANTLNNYTYLSGEPSVLLGAIDDCIRPGQPAFHYLAQTPKAVDLSRLVPLAGHISTAITFISPEGERSFAVAPGVSNDYPPSAIPQEIVRGSAVALGSLYCLRDPNWPIAEANLAFLKLAADAGVPVAFALGTAGLVKTLRSQVVDLLQRYVNLAAMNAQEARALTGEADVLLACDRILEWVDMVIITEGPRGLTMGGYVDDRYKRETDQRIRSKSIAGYNRWEYSRLMRRADCPRPLKIYSHIHPYRGGPDRMTNTSGAGDAALAAVLHDVAANQYHRTTVPQSEKHASGVPFLTYSSLSRCAQYGNRVAYEVLKGHSPRLDGPVGPDEAGQFNDCETS
jgi:inosine kinase